MTKRITRIELHLTMAALMAKRGACERAQVGCIIIRDNRIVASGYNGPPTNSSCNISECDFAKACDHAIHAEANAIAYASRFGIKLEGTVIYCTHSPCINCARLILQAGITELHYLHEYRNPGLNILGGLDIYRYTRRNPEADPSLFGMYSRDALQGNYLSMPTLAKVLDGE